MPAERLDRAVVLGGGGFAGVAWGCGYLTALEEASISARTAERIVGTSAGSVVAAWLTGGRPMARRFRFVEQSTNASRRILSALFGAAVGRPDAVGQQAVELLLESVSPTPESLRRLGELALAARTMPEPLFVGFTSALIGRRDWRNPSLRFTAHDTATGERVVFMPGHGIGLGRACAASSAVPGVFPPVAVHRRRFMDGGSCSATNADLAGGAERALVLSLLARRNPAPPTAMLGEIAALERGGTRVHAAWPDDASVAATDGDPLDPGIVPLLARAGRAQGRRDAPAVAALWS